LSRSSGSTGDVGANPGPPDDHVLADAAGEPGLELILEEIESVVDPIAEAAAFGPAVGIAVAGGPLAPMPPIDVTPGLVGSDNSVKAGLLAAGPVAIAGIVVNVAGALLVVAVARLVTSRSYGEIAQLVGIFFILSMPGSAVLVGVVRRVTELQASGQAHLVRKWVARVHRIGLAAIGVELVVVLILQGWIARWLGLPNGQGVVLILMAAGLWILLSVDRGLLQAHRSYRPLAANLMVEGGIRTACVLVFVVGGMGVTGYALGIFVSELLATFHAHWLANRAWANLATTPVLGVGAASASSAPGRPSEELLARRRLLADVSAAFVGLALLGLLQNIDVILLGRLNHAQVGPYAAISVASKGLVFGALVLGAYLLPEATIRWNEGGHAIRQLGVTLLFLAVPSIALLGIALFVPRQFLTLVFSARLATSAPAFAPLVLAMMCLSFTVLATNYLFGTGSRWIVVLLAGGSGLAVVLITMADGRPGTTAWANLIVQALLAFGMGVAFLAIHIRHRGQHWSKRFGWQRLPTR
jgi:O-antigen/teichoic acid export membrane protein